MAKALKADTERVTLLTVPCSSMPLVTVIIPTYNRASFITIAVDSVLEQTFASVEVIVIDDGSDDGTGDLLKERYGASVKYIYQNNRGASAARNRGIREAGGELIAFLDSDDRWERSKLEKQVPLLLLDDLMISHTQEIWYRIGRILNQKKKHLKRCGDLFEASLELCSISMSTVLARKDLFDQVGLFDENLPACEDYDMWLRVTSVYPVGLVDEPLTIKEGGRPDQLSQKIPRLDRFRIAAICKLIKSGNLDEDRKELALGAFYKKSSIYINGCRKHGREPEAREYESAVRSMGGISK